MAIKLRKNPIKRFANQPENQLRDEFTIIFFHISNDYLYLAIYFCIYDREDMDFFQYM